MVARCAGQRGVPPQPAPAPVVPQTTPPVSPPAPPVTTSRTPLAFTGSMLDTLLPIGALTLLAGAALIILGRRRVTPE